MVFTTLLIHIAAGGLGILSGALALSVGKGSTLHRKSGMVFVYVMVVMSMTGFLIAVVQSQEASMIAGLLTAYMVVTALATVRPLPRSRAASRYVDIAAMLFGCAIGSAAMILGFVAAATERGALDGIPAVVFFMFGFVGLLAGLSDLRMIRNGGVPPERRLARHLWRMCYALYVATSSFFLGQADEFPAPLRIPALLAVLGFMPLFVMVYWLWRVRRRGLRPVRPNVQPGMSRASI